MITWNNVYKDGQVGLAWSSALHAQLVNSWIVEFMENAQAAGQGSLL